MRYLGCGYRLQNVRSTRQDRQIEAVINRSGLLFQGDQRQKEFDQLVHTLKLMEAFELEYGIGSCINLQDPIVLQATINNPRTWKPDEVENAKKAPISDRMKILAIAA